MTISTPLPLVKCPFLRALSHTNPDMYNTQPLGMIPFLHALSPHVPNILDKAAIVGVSIAVVLAQRGIYGVLGIYAPDITRLDHVALISHTDLFQNDLPYVETYLRSRADTDGTVSSDTLVALKDSILMGAYLSIA